MRVGGEVYADLLFLVNFSMDFLCAYLTASLLHRRAVPWRLGLAAVLGGLYAVAALFLTMSRPVALLVDGGVCVLMCAILFAERGTPPKFFAIACAVFVGVSMAMGGMMTALFNLLNRASLPLEMLAQEGDGISTWMFALLAAVSAVMGLRGGKLLRKSASRRFARLTITVDGRSVEMQALVDSGNMCRDPISGRPVIFVEPRQAQALIGGGAGEKSPDVARRFRLIPTETIDGRRMQTAYLPDRITVTDASGTHEVSALFAPAATLEGAGVYQAIVSPELVT